MRINSIFVNSPMAHRTAANYARACCAPRIYGRLIAIAALAYVCGLRVPLYWVQLKWNSVCYWCAGKLTHAIHNFAIGAIISLTRVIRHFGHFRSPIQLTTPAPALVVAILSITFSHWLAGWLVRVCVRAWAVRRCPRRDTRTHSFVDDGTCLSDARRSICAGCVSV